MPPLERTDFAAIRERLAGKRGAGYWRSLAELAESPEFLDAVGREFPNPERLWQAPLSRRHTLQLLAASIALAGLTACSRQPEEFLVPYVRMPEHLILGKARYYATAALVGGYAHGVLAESHEGRPTKLEGNPDHPATLGACDAIAQASVLSLYDPDRSAAVRHKDTIAGYGAFLADLQQRHKQWDANQGRGLCFVAETVTSLSESAAMDVLRKRWPVARWFVHEPVDRRSVYAGSRILFNRALEPIYRFDQAAVVLALDADFLQAQPGFLRYAHDLMARRRPRDVDTRLSRLYAIESTPSVTGAVADHRQALPYQQIEAAARQLARALGLAVAKPKHPVLPAHWLKAVVNDLKRHRGAAVVVPGDQQTPAVHALAQAINHRLGAYGRTVDFIPPVITNHDAEPLSELTKAIRDNAVDSLVVLGANPVYSAPADLVFAEAYRQVPWRLHWGGYYDETGRLSHWHVPAAHPLETWGDARAYDGTASLIQPLIQPLHGGKSALQILAALDRGSDEDARQLLRAYWQGRYKKRDKGSDFEAFWRRSLHDGVLPDTAAKPVGITPRPDWPQRVPAPEYSPDVLTLQLRPDPALWDGRHANNGWLQEMPRPLTTLTWDNALLISPRMAEQRDVSDGDIVRLKTNGGQLEVPVFVLPGQPQNAVTLHLGQGRTHLGRVGDGVGVNAFKLQTRTAPWALPVELTPSGDHQKLALIQNHHHIEGRDLIRAANLDDYRKHPAFAREPETEISLYPEPWPAQREASHAWGMAIDLSACIGCNACVTACQAENNIPVVGAEEVSRGHDMHWLRIDRYFSGDLDAPGIVFQPVPCMHCENAPCEYVCPVGATQHSADGLNQMIYQRCVGTRYCSQNCPYKVRRFNWFDYTGRDAAYPAEPAVQNPDVTVRSRGVMEKCTYCVQRIYAARDNADAERRPIADGELQTACQQACPTQAIVFGDIADNASQVRQLKSHVLGYGMLTHLNTRPRTTYLAAVRNPNPDLNDADDRQG